MSLINEALKRAKQAQQQNPFGGAPAAPLQPVDYARRPNYVLRSLVALLALVTLACSGWFFWKWWASRAERRSVAVALNEAKADALSRSRAQQSFARKSNIRVSTNIVVRTNVVVTPNPEAEVRSSPTNASISTPQTNAAPTNASISTPQTNAALPAPSREPVAPPVEAAPPPSPFADLKLRSIIYREGKPAAVINGDMLYVGDEIRGARVIRIGRHTVIVERKGETNELLLPRL
jgi:hypothetical protein